MKRAQLLLTAALVACGVFCISLWWIYTANSLPSSVVKLEGSLVVGVIVAKESSYIEEWLAHHLYYGVDAIVIFDNNHPSDLQEKQATRRICESFGDRCEVMDFNLYDGVACVLTSSYLCSAWFIPSPNAKRNDMLSPTRRQGMAMKELYYHNDNYLRYQWVMMFDVDEFLITKDVHTTIPDVLKRLPPEVHGVHLPRLTFGTDNHTTRPQGGVRANYCWREKLLRNAKGMARAEHVMLPGIVNHYYPTHSMLSREILRFPKFISVEDVGTYEGARLLSLPHSGALQGAQGVVPKDEVVGVLKSNHLYIDPSVLAINHYFTKSREEFFERRSRQSLNYIYKLKNGLYRDDKLAMGRYNRHACDVQKLHLLPPLMSAADLKVAEAQINSTGFGRRRDTASPANSTIMTPSRRLRGL